MILKGIYELGKKQKSDNLGTLYNGAIVSNGLPVSIREYNNRYCHASTVDKLQEAIHMIASLKTSGHSSCFR